MGRRCSRPIGPSRRRRRGDPVYHSNSRSASPGVGAHKPFTPAPAGMASQTRTSAWTGGRVHARGRERERNARTPSSGWRSPSKSHRLRYTCKSHCHGGRLSCEPAPGAAEKGLAHPRGIAQRGKCPLFFLLERRNKRVWWVRRTNDRARSAQRSSVHACLGGVGGCLGTPRGPGTRYQRTIGEKAS